MEKVSQVFNLNENIGKYLLLCLETFCKETEELIRGLNSRGYDVSVGQNNYAGLPASILVVGEVKKPIKQDFQEIARTSGLSLLLFAGSNRGTILIDIYSSGEAYLEAKIPAKIPA